MARLHASLARLLVVGLSTGVTLGAPAVTAPIACPQEPVPADTPSPGPATPTPAPSEAAPAPVAETELIPPGPAPDVAGPEYWRARLADLSAQPLPPKGKLAVSVDKKTAALELASGTSPIVFLRLPDFIGPYRLTVKSHLIGMGFTKKIFVPIVQVLTEDFRPTRRLAEEDFKARHRGSLEPLRLDGALDFSAADREERYLLVYTDARPLQRVVGGGAPVAATVPVGSIGGAGIGIGFGIGPKFKRAAEGKLSFSLAPPKTANMKNEVKDDGEPKE